MNLAPRDRGPAQCVSVVYQRYSNATGTSWVGVHWPLHARQLRLCSVPYLAGPRPCSELGWQSPYGLSACFSSARKLLFLFPVLWEIALAWAPSCIWFRTLQHRRPACVCKARRGYRASQPSLASVFLSHFSYYSNIGFSFSFSLFFMSFLLTRFLLSASFNRCSFPFSKQVFCFQTIFSRIGGRLPSRFTNTAFHD